ncbi:hypothetical protein KC326_g173 [Hortaea werneckii]|nr:hypothetical protein KC326_g173 [Hortaea werneckii]
MERQSASAKFRLSFLRMTLVVTLHEVPREIRWMVSTMVTVKLIGPVPSRVSIGVIGFIVAIRALSSYPVYGDELFASPDPWACVKSQVKGQTVFILPPVSKQSILVTCHVDTRMSW